MLFVRVYPPKIGLINLTPYSFGLLIHVSSAWVAHVGASVASLMVLLFARYNVDEEFDVYEYTCANLCMDLWEVMLQK